AIVLITVAFMVPTHVLLSKMQAKFEINSLTKRQKQLHLTENLVVLFEQNMTFSRMMLPISEPIGWNKKTKSQLSVLRNKTKELVQSLNDNFSLYSTVVTPKISTPVVKPVVIEQPIVSTPVAPVFAEPEVFASVTPEPVITQIQPPPVVQPTVTQTEPQRKSALMQKFTRK
ncbi:MAG: hypothetical protein WBI40_00705, partial [Methylococcaceae bacterium]